MAVSGDFLPKLCVKEMRKRVSPFGVEALIAIV